MDLEVNFGPEKGDSSYYLVGKLTIWVKK